MNSSQPTQTKERYLILDALRGFALLGIALANFPEFSLYSFLDESATSLMPTAAVDKWVRFLEYVFVDGKFYTLFSLLFGIGFSIIIEHAEKRGANGFVIFYRRMFILLLIGIAHMLLLWSGDILALYAVLGMILPLFRRMSNRWLLRCAAFFLVLPVVVDAVVEMFALAPSQWFLGKQWHFCGLYGITEANFAYWLQQHDTYSATLQFLVQGAFERMTEFIDGNRYFKVLGLFILGFYVGRNRLYAKISEFREQMKTMLKWCAAVGVPLSVVYAWSSTHGHPWGLALHTLLYTLSVFPTAFAYVFALALIHDKSGDTCAFRFLAAPGRMALSNYLGQTLWGMILFYGIGLGLGTHVGLVTVVAIVVVVYVVEALFSKLWLHYFNYGLIEWIWRMLTYGKVLSIVKSADGNK